MAWSPQDIARFEALVGKLSSEAHLAKPDSDEGLLPLISLAGELSELAPEEQALKQCLASIEAALEPLVAEAKSFDESTLQTIRSLARWAESAIEPLKAHAPLPAFGEDIESSAADAEEIPASSEFGQEAATPAPEPEACEVEEIPANTCADTTPPIASSSDPAASQPALALDESGFWDETACDAFSSLARQLSAELLLADADSDEGMLPVYSLLREFESEFAENETVLQSLDPVRAKMDALLDQAKPFDPQAIQYLTEFNLWLETARSEIAQGRDPDRFEPSPDALDAHSHSGEAADPSETSEEKNPFADCDVVMDLNMEENKELLEEFHSEAVDHLGQIETAVLELEKDGGNRDAINSMFRSFHTIKGVAGFLNLIPANRLAHEVESLMDLVRNDKLPVFTGIIDLVLESKDAISRLLEQISVALNRGELPSTVVPVSHLMQRARWAAEGPESYAEAMGLAQIEPAAPSAEPSLDSGSLVAPSKSHDATENAPEPAVAEPQANAPRHSLHEPELAPARQAAGQSSTIRVNTWKLDNLMDMVGELVIVQSQLHESSKTEMRGETHFQRNLSQLSRITKDLQHTSMALRMIPIKSTFQKMGRLVRDLAAKSGKKIRFETVGEDTELDRNVVEEIGDPLVHMVRNACDHGIESAEDREAAGKRDVGSVTLKAYHQGSSIVIELQDDGRGIDPAKVLAKARANGIVREDEQLPTDEIYKLIFAPGFSTAEKITDVSGRGVGMDVVKRNIEKLRGKVHITSELGKGSTFKILLPLTMAIVDGLVIKVGDDRFILPTTSVKVALRPDEKILNTIQGNEEILNIRGKIIPLFRLHNHFQIPNAVTDPRKAIVVVVETGGKPYGLMVDDMVSKQEVVIKNLGARMQGISGISGGAILGDGAIALILDPASLTSAN